MKRFHSARAFSDKIDVLVDFPIEGLDISSYVANTDLTPEDCLYDLIAVDNHYGGLGGGHYTASVRISEMINGIILMIVESLKLIILKKS